MMQPRPAESTRLRRSPSTRRLARLYAKQLKAFEHDGFLDRGPKDIVGKGAAARYGIDVPPRSELFRQSRADHVAGESAQSRARFRFEDKNAHEPSLVFLRVDSRRSLECANEDGKPVVLRGLPAEFNTSSLQTASGITSAAGLGDLPGAGSRNFFFGAAISPS